MDGKTLFKNINLTFPTKYYEDPHSLMVEIGPYLYKEHGYTILQLFSPLQKERTISTTWDPETGEPVLAPEYMAGIILAENLEDWLLDNISKKKYP